MDARDPGQDPQARERTLVIIDLTGTTSSEISSALIKARRNAGSPAMGIVGTVVVVADESIHHDALKAANATGREHPHRALVVISRPGRGAAGLDAEVRVGEGVPGETVLLRLHGELSKHAASVVTPLLLPDSPVIVWWPGGGPKVPAEDAIGALGRRRVTDAAATRRAAAAFESRAAGYQPGDTDFAWTRLTPWRALLAAALDQYPTPINGAEVTSERGNTSADLLSAWLQYRLKVPVEQKDSRGPGITAVRLFTPAGEIALTRPDGRVANLRIPGQPDRPVALHRRDPTELLSEELRRLDPDDVYAQTLQALVERQSLPESDKRVPDEIRKSEAVSAARAAARTAPTTTKQTTKQTPTRTTKKTAKKTATKTATKKTAGKGRR
jgi:glucose-6-phosphate dehydrogenase assembly protein OpcA